MTNTNPDSGLPTHDLSTSAFISSKEVVSRRNQDGTVILMRLDESSLFYKVDQFAAVVWGEFETAKTAEALIQHFSGLHPACAAQLSQDIPALIKRLTECKLLVQAPVDSATQSFRQASNQAQLDAANYLFGGVHEFNLEQIETEILNESVYLDVFAGSDMRLKKDIEPITDALSKVTRLEGVTYQWDQERIPEEFGSKYVNVKTGRTHVGFIAQQVAEQMPELVRSDEQTGLLAVEYNKMTCYLLESIKELNKIVIAQDNRIRDLENRLKGQ
jgi:hypothetical protein